MLKNLKIKTKFLIAIAMLGLISLAGLMYVTSKFHSANQSYTGFLQNESAAATLGARAAAGIWTSTTWLSRAVTQEPGSPAFDNISKRFGTEFAGARDRLSQIPSLVASRKDAIAELLAGADGLKTIGDQLIAARAANDAEAVQNLSAKLDDAIIALSPKFGANNKAMADLLDNGGRELSASVSATILSSIVGLIVGIVAAIAFAMTIAQKGITAPMAKLRERMASLAEGETRADIDGLDRRDEIGQMASAVAVFRANALERLRIEQQAEAARSMSETDRLQREAEKTAEAANLQTAVQALGHALGDLADGDLACRIDMPFTGDLDTLRQDFNSAVLKLNGALQAVGANAEIRASADDLSKRTEQQAASVEETAAALEEITTTVKDSAKRAEESASWSSAPVSAPKSPARSSARPSPPCRRSKSLRRDLQHHRRHRRHRLPDQPAGAECRCRGSPRRRCRQGLCGRRPGSARTGPALGQCRQGNQGADQHLGRRRSNPASRWSAKPARRWRRSSAEVQEINRTSAPSSPPRANSRSACRRSTPPSTPWTRAPSRTPPWSRNRRPPATFAR
jgi:methyl-accepting chemotaxis protein